MSRPSTCSTRSIAPASSSARRSRAIRARVVAGQYPAEPYPLAKALVKKRILTEYQARCLLHRDEPVLALGRYVILDRIGRGSMGRVFLARHRMMGREVALKVIAPRLATHRRAVERFLREMRLSAGWITPISSGPSTPTASGRPPIS